MIHQLHHHAMKATATKNEELQGMSHIARTVAACLQIKVPSKAEIAFRGCLLRKATAELPTLKPNFLVRLYESACSADFPDADVIAFRKSLESHLGRYFNLAEHRQTKTQPQPA